MAPGALLPSAPPVSYGDEDRSALRSAAGPASLLASAWCSWSWSWCPKCAALAWLSWPQYDATAAHVNWSGSKVSRTMVRKRRTGGSLAATGLVSAHARRVGRGVSPLRGADARNVAIHPVADDALIQ